MKVYILFAYDNEYSLDILILGVYRTRAAAEAAGLVSSIESPHYYGAFVSEYDVLEE